MNKKYVNAAVAMLLALGVNACSSGGGSANNLVDAGISTEVDKSKTPVDTKKSDGSESYTSTIIASEEEIAKRKAEIKAAEDKAKEEAAQKAKSEAEKLAKEEADRLAEEENARKLKEAERLLEEEKARQKKIAEDESFRKAEEERLKSEEARKAEEARQKAIQEAEAIKKAAEEEAKAKQRESEAKAKADLIKNGLLSSMFNQAGSESYAYLNDQAKKEILLSTLKNDISACKAKTGTKCASEAKQGEIIFSDYQSYSGYAVIREDASLKDMPNNAYVAVVDVPTTEKAAIPVDATYKGSAVYTSKQGNNYTGYTVTKKEYNTDFTLNIKDFIVSGDIKLATGKKPTIVEFENANIQVANDAVVFEGKAVFNTAAPLALVVKDVNGEKIDKLDGSYRGQFAGKNAEEVVGTFETDSKLKEASVQGAFMGKQVGTEGK